MALPKQQFNVALPPDLIRRIKHEAIDRQSSLSDLLALVLEEHFATGQGQTGTDRPGRDDAQRGDAHRDEANRDEANRDDTGVRLQPVVHVDDLTAAVGFWELIGAQVREGRRDGDWALLEMGGAAFSLSALPPNAEQDHGPIELTCWCTGPVAELEDRLRAADAVVVAPTTDEAVGRRLQVRTPDGLLVTITERQSDLYT